MPFMIRKVEGRGFCVYTEGADGQPVGEPHGCHPTEAEARKQQAALYVHVPEARKAQPMITFGGAVKALGDGRVAGYLVQWGDEATQDADGEWFTPETDFETDLPCKCAVRYHHGMDPSFGRGRLAWGKMERDDRGIRVTAQLDVSDPKQAKVYRRCEDGELGWSSASLVHVTDPSRDQPGGPIKSWPGIAHDASLTPIPSDRRNVAYAVKSMPLPPVEAPLLDDLPALPASLAEDLDRVADHVERVSLRCAGIKAGRSQFSRSRWERIARLRDELTALLSETAPRAGEPDAESAPSPGPGEGDETPRVETAPPMREAWPGTHLPDMSIYFDALLRQESAA